MEGKRKWCVRWSEVIESETSGREVKQMERKDMYSFLQVVQWLHNVSGGKMDSILEAHIFQEGV